LDDAVAIADPLKTFTKQNVKQWEHLNPSGRPLHLFSRCADAFHGTVTDVDDAAIPGATLTIIT
jgi:hypothetical protein